MGIMGQLCVECSKRHSKEFRETTSTPGETHLHLESGRAGHPVTRRCSYSHVPSAINVFADSLRGLGTWPVFGLRLKTSRMLRRHFSTNQSIFDHSHSSINTLLVAGGTYMTERHEEKSELNSEPRRTKQNIRPAAPLKSLNDLKFSDHTSAAWTDAVLH